MEASFADTLEGDVRCEELIPEKSSHMRKKILIEDTIWHSQKLESVLFLEMSSTTE